MFFSCILLAFCSTLDSLGIGITYGLKNTKILLSAKIILFACSFSITLFALFLGNYFSTIFPSNITDIIGAVILIIIGIFLVFSCFKKENNFDFDYSNNIDSREAVFLGLALSLDSFGIGISSSMLKIGVFLLPLIVAIFQLLFLSFGNFLGRKIKSASHIPDNIWSILAGSLLIFIGIVKIFH